MDVLIERRMLILSRERFWKQDQLRRESEDDHVQPGWNNNLVWKAKRKDEEIDNGSWRIDGEAPTPLVQVKEEEEHCTAN